MRCSRRLFSRVTPAGPLRGPILLGPVLLAVGLLGTACTKKPSEDQCEAFADHFVELLQESREKPDSRIRKLATSQRQSLIDACVQEGSVEEVECVLAQSSIGEVEANCK